MEVNNSILLQTDSWHKIGGLLFGLLADNNEEYFSSGSAASVAAAWTEWRMGYSSQFWGSYGCEMYNMPI